MTVQQVMEENMRIASLASSIFICVSLAFVGVAFLGLVFASRHFMLFMVSLELFYSSIIVFFILSSYYLNDPMGQVFAIFLLCLAAVEAVVGFCLAISAFRSYRVLDMLQFSELRN